jgi:phage gp46-like protein
MDIAVIETGNGGDIQLSGNDLLVQGGIGNMPYLGMFGGNLGFPTKEKLITEHAFDWWGNNLLMPQSSSTQFSSLFEKKLLDVALTSAGRIQLEQAIKQDLKFMEEFAVVTVAVSIIGVDRIHIHIKLQQPNNLNGRVADVYREFIYIWDATARSLGDFSPADFNDDFFI